MATKQLQKPSGNRKISLERATILPDGVYAFRVENCEYKEGEKSDYLAVRLKIQPSGDTVFQNVMLSQNWRAILSQFFDSLGMPKKGDITPRALIGKSGWCVLKGKEYQGRESNEVARWITAEVAQQLKGDVEPSPKGSAAADDTFDYTEADDQDGSDLEDDVNEDEFDDLEDDDDLTDDEEGDGLPD